MMCDTGRKTDNLRSAKLTSGSSKAGLETAQGMDFVSSGCSFARGAALRLYTWPSRYAIHEPTHLRDNAPRNSSAQTLEAQIM
jgi:hypothetical protein